MATLDWSQGPAVESAGKAEWRMDISRYTHASIRRIRKPRGRSTVDEIVDQFDITREQIRAVLEFARPPFAPSPPIPL